MFGNLVAARDLDLLLFAVARQAHHFHAVEQRLRNRVERIGRHDEEDLRNVERQVEVVVAKCLVLLGIEDFEQRRRRIAAEIAPEFVHLVQHQHRIVDAGPPDRLDDPAGHGADIGTAVAAQFGFVMHAAQTQPLELAAQRAGDRLAE